VPDKILKRYAVDPNRRESMLNELRTLGITDAKAAMTTRR
jgi:hypothetical protein